MNRFFMILFLLSLLALACSTQKNVLTEAEQVQIDKEAQVDIDKEVVVVVEDPQAKPEGEADDEEVYEMPEEEITEERTLDELVVTAPRGYVLPKYNPAEERPWDLLHMDLDIRFDWVNEHVLGRADLTMKPYFFDQDQIILDAKGFEIHDVADRDGRTLSYEYDGMNLTIDLTRSVSRDEEVFITVDYIAKPSEGPSGGSAAITSSKGLFFINPREEEPNKPRQIWTQGETEHNSRWFPTFDQPNESMTHDIRLTVEDQFVTLSNGDLVSSRQHSNNTRTDHWRMDQPHAPYLVMVAVGDFAVVREEVDGILLEYYVEPEYGKYAKEIFAHTPEMIRFFAEKLDYPYPWSKFSQIITKDYVSGAMENTTAVIYGDFIQKTDRELIDNANDFIIAHELFHHWFGDLVTTESWANLTLQEGFANYSEHLWQEYKYGDDAAGFQRKNERQGYLSSIMQTGTHPLIWYGYDDKEQMFDGHSYNKGGLVLHMLRHYLGDDAFYSGLNKYLKDHAYSAVEVDELRMAFEDVAGIDLHWFFDQWYLEAGHPILELTYDYDPDARTLSLTVDQTQDAESSSPIYQLPVTVGIFDGEGNETQYDLFIDDREEIFEFDYESVPALVVFDRDDHLLFIKGESKTTQEYMNQYRWVDRYIHRFEAINKIKSRREAQEVIIEALQDGHFSIRRLAVENVRLNDRPDLVNVLENLAVNDPHSSVRGAAIRKLKSVSDFDMSSLIQKVLQNELSYMVVGDALETLNRIDPELATEEAVKLKKEKTGQLIGPVSRILSASGDSTHIPYFEERLTRVGAFYVFNFYNAYYELLKQMDPVMILEKAGGLKSVAINPSNNMFYRYTATNAIHKLSQDLVVSNAPVAQKLKTMIADIKSVETNEMLLQRYSGF